MCLHIRALLFSLSATLHRAYLSCCAGGQTCAPDACLHIRALLFSHCHTTSCCVPLSCCPDGQARARDARWSLCLHIRALLFSLSAALHPALCLCSSFLTQCRTAPCSVLVLFFSHSVPHCTLLCLCSSFLTQCRTAPCSVLVLCAMCRWTSSCTRRQTQPPTRQRLMT
jgi:hypothetical protein